MVDNLTDALYMAGAILIFVIALTVSMTSFSTMRSQIDIIVEMDSQMDLVKDESKSYLNYMSTSTTSDIRTVGIETIVSSMYRVAKENYVIYIKAADLPENVLMSLEETAERNIGDQTFPDGGTLDASENVLYININGKNSNIEELLKTKNSSNDTVYEILAGKRFKEYLGVYQENTEAGEANKTTYRVITYVEITT